MPTSASLSTTLAAAISRLGSDGVPQDVKRAAELSLLDAVGVSLAASGMGEGCRAFADIAIEEGGAGESSLLGFGARVPAHAAAWVNGSLAHALDYEDAVDGFAVHPNAQVVPAALALAELVDASGERLVTAIALGCDVAFRFARAAGDTMSDRGWYPPPIVGALGATAACANLMQLTPRQVLDALSLTVSQTTASGEIKHSPESVIRGIRDSFAAQSAVRSVQLAARGIRGFDAPIEGRSGFFACFAGGEYDAGSIVDGLGESFVGTRVSYKIWPSCRGTHAFIEGALALRNELILDEIDEIELIGAPVNTMLDEPHDAKRAPATAIDAKFSLPFTVATALLDGEVTLGSFDPAALTSQPVLRVAERVKFTADPGRAGADGMTTGIIRITTRSGRVLTHEVLTPRGSPQAALSTDELRAKFFDCAKRAAVPVAEPDELARTVLGIREFEGVRAPLGLSLGRPVTPALRARRRADDAARPAPAE